MGSRINLIETSVSGSLVQPREDRFSPFSKLFLFRDEFLDTQGPGSSPSGPSSGPEIIASQVYQPSFSLSQGNSFPVRLPECGSRSSPVRSRPSEINPILSSSTLGSSHQSTPICYTHLSGSSPTPAFWLVEGLFQDGVPSHTHPHPHPPYCYFAPNYGCKHVGMGSSSGACGPGDLWDLVPGGDFSAHKDACCQVGSGAVPACGLESVCDAILGQHHSGSLCQETGRYTLPVSFSRNKSLLLMCNRIKVTHLSKHIPVWLNAPADGLSHSHKLFPVE